MSIIVEREIAGRKLTIETGKLAKQAAGAVTVRYADSVVLVAVSTDEPRFEGQDFLPLTVDYRERGYAAGYIFGGRFKRREGPPSEKEILTMRLIDRPVRPLFPDGYFDEVLVSALVLSADRENDPDILAMIGASAALSVSALPFAGPLAACRIGKVDGELVVNPTYKQMEESALNLTVASKKDGIIMVEAGAAELSEAEMIDALELARQTNSEVVEMIEDLARQVSPAKADVPANPVPALADTHMPAYAEDVRQALLTPGKFGRKAALKDVKKKFLEAEASELEDEVAAGKLSLLAANGVFAEIHYRVIREMIMDGVRVDGRKTTEVREISTEVGLLPYAHGSALFTRGETQAIATTTLGTADDEQLGETLIGETTDRFLLHYNFPSFCVGEVKMPRGPSRREIGHGALAKRALLAVMPSFEEFPYTIRVVSEVLESNGSSSMATVCGGSLSLMDAGVPVKSAVAGVAMGLVKEGDKIAVLTDILGDEDHYGDMDFKVAGTSSGITALQMDIKISGITKGIMEKALAQAAEARTHILARMNSVLESPRPEISENAPKIVQIMIDTEKIGKVIGPGGATIKGIQEETGTEISIEDDGRVSIYGPNKESAEAARQIVESLTEAPKVGKIYTGKVRTIKDFGVFVEIIPGTDGLVHVSELSSDFIEDIEGVVKIGDEFPVKLLSIDNQGRLRLSRRAAEAEINGEPYEERPAPSGKGGDRRPRKDGRSRNDRDRRKGGGRGRSD
ncbi:MAG: polyribonucleotide nucleotidyltransferase [Planctomycetes bacterium]|nr:polyribonucleotide nucleotidyltransferase [Planctomycetota bacterium]